MGRTADDVAVLGSSWKGWLEAALKGYEQLQDHPEALAALIDIANHSVADVVSTIPPDSALAFPSAPDGKLSGMKLAVDKTTMAALARRDQGDENDETDERELEAAVDKDEASYMARSAADMYTATHTEHTEALNHDLADKGTVRELTYYCTYHARLGCYEVASVTRAMNLQQLAPEDMPAWVSDFNESITWALLEEHLKVASVAQYASIPQDNDDGTKNAKWLQLRQYRLTGSMAGKYTNSLVQQLVGLKSNGTPSRFWGNEATRWGNNNEANAMAGFKVSEGGWIVVGKHWCMVTVVGTHHTGDRSYRR